MPIIASGQITLTDLNDAKQLAMYIGASQARTVIFNGVSTYVPNYATTNQVLTPQLYVAGISTDIITQATSIRWFYQTNGAGTVTEITASDATYALATSGVKTLTIKQNVLAANTSMTYICEVVYPDPNTNFNIVTKAEIEVVRVSNGIDGQGSNAVIGVLSNESHTIPATSAGVVTSYGGANCTFSVYNGATDDTANWTISQSRSTGVTVTEPTTSRTATVTGVTTDVSTVTFTATRSGYSSITKVFTLSKVKGGVDGTSGTDSTSYWVVTPSVIQKSSSGVYTPTSITVGLKSQTGVGAVTDYAGRITIEDSTNGSTFTNRYTSSANEASKAYTPLANVKALRVRMHLAGTTPNGSNYIDEQIIPIVADGVDGISGVNAIIGVLTNETHALPANSSGTVSTYGGASSTFTLYNGATDDTANWTITQTRSTGTVVTEATTSRTATVTAVTTDVATVTFTATRSGFADVVKTFTLTKVKGGANGSSSTSYWIVLPPAIQKNSAGVYSPASVTVGLKSQTGTGAVVDYSGRITIEDTANGTTFTNRYTSTANESSRAYVPLAGIKALRVRMHLANVVPNGTNHIDEEIISVVADGVDSVYASVWNPDGNAVRNGNGSVKCQVDLYSGSTLVEGTAYKWYSQDPTATTASGGDADGGAGWRLLSSTYNLGVTGYNTATIIVPAGAIQGMESFKSVVTYNGVKYSGVTTVIDLSDPILARLDGLDKFKNGEGTVTIRATLLQAGAEIDAAGTAYTYKWSIYNADNIKTSFTATGKSVVVNASDINGRGNLVCDVETI